MKGARFGIPQPAHRVATRTTRSRGIPVHTHRTDSNQPQVITDLRMAHFMVADTSMVGGGFPDLVVSRNGLTKLVEIKSPGGRLAYSQADFLADWQDEVIIAHSAFDVIRYFNHHFARQQRA